MRASSLPLPSLEPRTQSWLDHAIAVCICILAVAAPIIISIVATPTYALNQVDTFPGLSDNL
jgi:hypothetical protein